MFVLEAQVNRMLPLIDSELECVDRNHAKLTQLSTNLVEAINMYHMLMRESEGFLPSQMYGVPPQNHFINQAIPMPNHLIAAQQYQQLNAAPFSHAPSGFVPQNQPPPPQRYYSQFPDHNNAN